MAFSVYGNNIRLTRGDSATLLLSITDKNKLPFELCDRDFVYFTVKHTDVSQTTAFQKKLSIEEYDTDTKQLKIQIDPADTDGLSCKPYKYDIELKLADGTVNTIIEPSSFIITPEITCSEDEV
jgi:hypothetical protein